MNAPPKTPPRKDNTLGTTGVAFYKRTGKWQAYTFREGRQVHIGYFVTRDAAVEAVNAERR